MRQEQLKDKDFFKDHFEVYDSVADLYVYFYEVSHCLLRRFGRFGMVTSNKFMRAAYGKNLREFLSRVAYVREILDFGDLPVFLEVSAYPCIVLTIKGDEERGPIRYLRVPSLDFDSLERLVEEQGGELPSSVIEDADWRLVNPEEFRILEKMEQIGVPLKVWLGDTKINYGIKTGLNEAFFIDEATRARLIAEDPKSAEIIKPLVVGEDIKRYEIEFRNRYLIFTRRGIDIDRYPAIKGHLEQFRERLEPRPPNWDEEKQGKWPGRKPGAYAWYEIQDTIDYYADFENPKILYQDIAERGTFAYDTQGLFANNTVYLIGTSNPFLLGLLNGKLVEFWFRRTGAEYRGGYLRFFSQYMERIPICRIAFVTPQEERARLVEEGKHLYREALEKTKQANTTQALFSDLLAFVEERLKKIHQPDPELVRKHNADPLNKDWQISERQPWEQSDVVHDILAFLAEEMIRMNREKQKEMKAFLSWLEAELNIQPDKKGRIGIEALTGKTKLNNYLGDYQKGEPELPFGEFWEILRKNKSRIGRPLSHEFMAQLQEAYEWSLTKLRPIKERLRLTDALIDQIVYRLYGLTEEEIRIVEGG